MTTFADGGADRFWVENAAQEPPPVLGTTDATVNRLAGGTVAGGGRGGKLVGRSAGGVGALSGPWGGAANAGAGGGVV